MPPPTSPPNAATPRRATGAVVGVALALGAIVLIVASIESIGLVGETDTRTSWPLFLVGVGLFAVAPSAAIRIRWRAWRARPALAAYGLGTLGGVVIAPVSGSIALGVVTGLMTAVVVAVL